MKYNKSEIQQMTYEELQRIEEHRGHYISGLEFAYRLVKSGPRIISRETVPKASPNMIREYALRTEVGQGMYDGFNAFVNADESLEELIDAHKAELRLVTEARRDLE